MEDHRVVHRRGEAHGVDPTKRQHHPRQGPDHAAELGEQLVGGLIQPVGILDEHNARAGQNRGHEVDHDFSDLHRPVLGVDPGNLGRLGNLGVEHDGNQRRPGHQAWCYALQPLDEGIARRLAGQVPVDPRHVAQQDPHREVGARPGVEPTAGSRQVDVRVLAEQLLDEPGLADTGLAHEIDHAAIAAARSVERDPQLFQLRLATHERDQCRVVGSEAVVRLDQVADDRRVDGSGLALHLERLECGQLERCRRGVEDRLAGDELARRGLLHEPRSEVDGVAHHREGPALWRPQVTHEDRAPVHAGTDRQSDVGRHDRRQRPQRCVLVLASGPRRTGGQDHLAATGVDVACQPVRAVTLGRLVHHTGERLQSSLGLGRPVLAKDLVQPTEEDERHGDRTVLGDHACRGLFEQPVRQVRLDLAVRLSGMLAQPDPGAGIGHEGACTLAVGAAERLGGDQRSRRRGQENLASLGVALAVHGGSHARANHEQFLPTGVDEMQVEEPRVHALGDPQLDSTHQRRRPRALDQVPHAPAAGRRAQRVIVALEQDEQGVATELQDVASVVVDDVDHAAEAAIEQDRQLLGALAPERSEPFRQRSEARDVR